MQLSHVISDLVLAASGAYSFVRYFPRLGVQMATLWGVFLVPVALAALFGALRFAGVHENMVDISNRLQQVVATLGSCGLMLGSYGLISRGPPQKVTVYAFLVAGLVMLALVVTGVADSLRGSMQLVAMVSVLACGLAACVMGKQAIGAFLLAALVLSAAAVWSGGYLSSPALRIDVFHYLLAASLICFGLAANAKSRG
ncbi:MAG: hypothetical protein KF752_03205 [Pirellulaceae bacterium]|nr:hypothetical protein [Pirellulaceae bacterium]